MVSQDITDMDSIYQRPKKREGSYFKILLIIIALGLGFIMLILFVHWSVIFHIIRDTEACNCNCTEPDSLRRGGQKSNTSSEEIDIPNADGSSVVRIYYMDWFPDRMYSFRSPITLKSDSEANETSISISGTLFRCEYDVKDLYGYMHPKIQDILFFGGFGDYLNLQREIDFYYHGMAVRAVFRMYSTGGMEIDLMGQIGKQTENYDICGWPDFRVIL